MPDTIHEWRLLTGVVIGIIVAVTVIYDVAARVFGGNEATFSAVLMDASHLWPIIPLIVGLLCGHVFWNVR